MPHLGARHREDAKQDSAPSGWPARHQSFLRSNASATAPANKPKMMNGKFEKTGKPN